MIYESWVIGHVWLPMQIEKDLLRTLTNNMCFATIKSTGIPRLRRILRGLAWLYPDIGYCQASFTKFLRWLPSTEVQLLSLLVCVVGYGNGCGYVPTSNGGRGCFLDDDGSHRGTSPSLILLTQSHRRSGKQCETRIENGCFIYINFELPGGSDGPSWFDSNLLALGGRSNARTRHRTLSHYSQLVSYT